MKQVQSYGDVEKLSCLGFEYSRVGELAVLTFLGVPIFEQICDISELFGVSF